MRISRESSATITAVIAPFLHEENRRSNGRRRRERRQRDRLQISLPARLKPFDPKHIHLEEVQSTLNFNRDGLYFATWAEHYSLGMRVLVSVPFQSASYVRREYLGKVVRLEPLADGRRGVALEFVF
jgi:hypothetical protein